MQRFSSPRRRDCGESLLLRTFSCQPNLLWSPWKAKSSCWFDIFAANTVPGADTIQFAPSLTSAKPTLEVHPLGRVPEGGAAPDEQPRSLQSTLASGRALAVAHVVMTIIDRPEKKTQFMP